MTKIEHVRIGIVGLGYVGLPLAVAMAQHFPVVAFDVDPNRMEELRLGADHTREVRRDELENAANLFFCNDPEELRSANFYIVTVPTPIDEVRQPDLSALKSASETIGRILSPGDVVVYESTVYPGLTEEICAPILARTSSLTLNQDFFVGYSPERINPGDPSHRLSDIVKVTSGSTPEAAYLIDSVYARVAAAGTHRASSIRVAEASKVIENIQRDVNIALVNELAKLFSRMGIESREVFAAAGTKWNFHAYSPGLVGGHCIGVDPYYLTHKAQSIGFHPEMIMAGRRINDGMADWVALEIVKAMLRRQIEVRKARVLVLGLTFKENCPDVRNTKVADLVAALTEFVGEVVVFDPHADRSVAEEKYGIALARQLPTAFDVVVLAVRHKEFQELGEKGIRELLRPGGIIYDVKQVLPIEVSDERL